MRPQKANTTESLGLASSSTLLRRLSDSDDAPTNLSSPESAQASNPNSSTRGEKPLVLNGTHILTSGTQTHPHKEMKKDISDGSISSSCSSTVSENIINESTITSSTHRRYKNSPFGLTNHYLAMPEATGPPGEVAKTFSKYTLAENGAKSRKSVTDKQDKPEKKSRHHLNNHKRSNSKLIDSDTSEQMASSSSQQTAEKVLSWSKKNNSGAKFSSSSYQDLTQLSGHPNACDLSVIVPSSAASLADRVNDAASDWRRDAGGDYKQMNTKTNQPAQLLDPIGLVGISSPCTGRSVHQVATPAGDAGLDAQKCNAKGGHDCYSEDLTLGQPNKLAGHHKQQHYNDSHKVRLSSNHSHHSKTMSSSSSSGLLVKFSSIMYATFLVILGCILHISELRQKSMNSSDHIYTIIVAVIGIIWLLFLQLDLHRYKRYARKYILIEAIFDDHHQRNLEAHRQMVTGELALDPSARSTSSSSASLVNDRMSMNTEVIFKKTAYKMYQQRAAAMNNRHDGRYLGASSPHHQHRYSNRSGSAKLSSSNGSADPICEEKESMSINGDNDLIMSDLHPRKHLEDLVPAYKFRHGKMGANFYLKCGMAAFCFGHVIHEGLRFGQQLYFFGTGNFPCRDSAALVAHLVTPLYSFYQLFMMFKYSNLVINRHKVLARFGLMHIIGTSVTFWFRTIIEEAFEDFVHKMDYFRVNKPQLGLGFTNPSPDGGDLSSLLTAISRTLQAEASEQSDLMGDPKNTTVAKSILALMSSPISATITPQIARNLPESYACAQNTLLTTKSMNALPYLYPFTIEYNLLLAATFLSLYFNIGKIGISDSATCVRIISRASSRMYHQDGHNGTKIPIGSSASSRMSHVESNDQSSATGFGAGGADRAGGHNFGEYKSNFVVNADCHAANKGLFCGFFVLLVTLVTIVIFFVTINKPSHVQLGIKINLIQEATLTSLIVIITLAAFKQIVKLNRNPLLKDRVTTDDVLMLIPLPFFFIHSLLSFRAETASMYSNSNTLSSVWVRTNPQGLPTAASSSNSLQSILLSDSGLSQGNNSKQAIDATRLSLNSLLAGLVVTNSTADTNSSRRNNYSSNSGNNSGSSKKVDHFKLLTLALNLIVMIEVLVQTNFIIDGMRRCSQSRYLRFKKPGRELITFAIILNITYWIVATFETKSVEQYKTEIEYYGPLPYMFISHTTLPVMLFYRYHSSVCLAEIWNKAYKPPKKQGG